MSSDAELIAKAIESTDYVKDYIVPIATAFGSAFFGGVSAVYINNRQDLKHISRDNLIAATKVFIIAEECIRKLVTFKSSYIDLDTREPLLRAIRIGSTAIKLEDVSYDSSSLYFIKAIPTANKPFIERIKWKVCHNYLKRPVKLPPVTDTLRSWRNPIRINIMFTNYNTIMDTIRERERINEKIREPLLTINSETPSIENIHEKLGRELCKEIIDVTEALIALLDHVIVELNDFLKEFPAIAESNIELSRITEWGKIPTYHNTRNTFLKCLIPILKPNYAQLSAYVGLPEEDVRKIYTYKSWKE